MTSHKLIVCRRNSCDRYEDAPLPESPGDGQEWCQPGVTCNRPNDPMRDDLGLYELEERLWLNHKLLSSWNRWTRSPYCQCTYSTGNPPSTGLCRACVRPMNPDSERGLNATEFKEHERIRRLRAGPTWIVVYEYTVRAAEVALKLLIKATGPAPEGRLPSYGKHNLRALWEQLPPCSKHEILAEMQVNTLEASNPRVITATGETVSNPRPIQERPAFEKFGEEFDTVRYAWDKLPDEGIDKFNELAREWPDPIELYYLHLWTQGVLSILRGKSWDSGTKRARWDREVRLSPGLDDSSFHSDWPSTYIDEEPKVLRASRRRPSLDTGDEPV